MLNEDLAGHWEGEGVNHLDEPFTAELDLNPVVDSQGLSLMFRATGEDGTVFYRLRGLLAGDRLAFVDNNIGELKILDRLQSASAYAFGLGNAEDEDIYRLEISFDLIGPDEMSLCFAWGLPGQEFAPHSCGKLTRKR